MFPGGYLFQNLIPDSEEHLSRLVLQGLCRPRTCFGRLLRERLTATADEHHIEAAMARVRLRPRATAKSHRHSTLFNKLQVAGVQRPGDILALITQRSLTGLADLVQHASPMQLTQLSAVAEVTPYEVPIERGAPRSVVTLFDGSLDDGSSLRSRGLEDLNRRGLQLKPYGKTQDSYTSSSLPPDETLRHMPWLRRVRPVMRFRSATQLGPHPIRPLKSFPFRIDPCPCRSSASSTQASIPPCHGSSDWWWLEKTIYLPNTLT